MAMVHASCNKPHGNRSCHMLQAPLTYVSCNTHHMKRFNHPMKIIKKNKVACFNDNIYFTLLYANHKNTHNLNKPSQKQICPFCNGLSDLAPTSAPSKKDCFGNFWMG